MNTVNGTIRGADTITLSNGSHTQDCVVAGASTVVAAQGGISDATFPLPASYG